MTCTRTATARIGTTLSFALFLAHASFAQPATHVVQVAYVIPKGQTAKPKAAAAIGAIMSQVQSFYFDKLGVTFQLADPLVTQFDIPEDAVAAIDWNDHMARINQHFPQQYNTDKDIIVEIIEGSTGDAGGSNGTVKMTGDFWNTAYNAYLNQSQSLIQNIAAFPHELGHAFGLMHSLDTKSCLAKEGVDMGDLPNLIMQQTGNAGNVYNYGIHADEKKLLTDTTYHVDCLGFLGGRPHPTTYLTRTSMQAPPPTGWNVNLVDFAGANGSRLGAYRQVAANIWVEQNVQGLSIFNFTEQRRDDWSVYLFDASRKVNIQLDLFTKKIMYSDTSSSSPRQLYTVLDASAKMSGYLTSQVFYIGNQPDEVDSFVFTGTTFGVKVWTEYSATGQVKFTFGEIGRDASTVILLDPTRNVYIQLDLNKQQVLFRSGNTGNFSTLYNMLLGM